MRLWLSNDEPGSEKNLGTKLELIQRKMTPAHKNSVVPHKQFFPGLYVISRLA